jgi:hypothetical protein
MILASDHSSLVKGLVLGLVPILPGQIVKILSDRVQTETTCEAPHA